MNAEKRMLEDAPFIVNKLLCKRDYLHVTFSDILLKSFEALLKTKPDDPVEFIAYFLLKHNPSKSI